MLVEDLYIEKNWHKLKEEQLNPGEIPHFEKGFSMSEEFFQEVRLSNNSVFLTGFLENARRYSEEERQLIADRLKKLANKVMWAKK